MKFSSLVVAVIFAGLIYACSDDKKNDNTKDDVTENQNQVGDTDKPHTDPSGKDYKDQDGGKDKDKDDDKDKAGGEDIEVATIPGAPGGLYFGPEVDSGRAEISCRRSLVYERIQGKTAIVDVCFPSEPVPNVGAETIVEQILTIESVEDGIIKAQVIHACDGALLNTIVNIPFTVDISESNREQLRLNFDAEASTDFVFERSQEFITIQPIDQRGLDNIGCLNAEGVFEANIIFQKELESFFQE